MTQIDFSNLSFMQAFLYLVAFLVLGLIISFFNKKMDNMATKDDIGGITKEIEAVKQEYREKNSQLSAQLELLNQYKFSFAEEKRKTLLKYFDLLSESIHTVNGMNLYKFNESLDKLNKNDELTLPILKRIAMLTRKKKLGQLHHEITASINLIVSEAVKMIEDCEKRNDLVFLFSTTNATTLEAVKRIKKKNFDTTDELFRGIKVKKYEEYIFPLEQNIHDLIYKELKEIMSDN